MPSFAKSGKHREGRLARAVARLDTIANAANMALAERLGARSLALVAFGTGVGGFPLGEAARIETKR